MSIPSNRVSEEMDKLRALVTCAASAPPDQALGFLFRAQDAMDTAVLLLREQATGRDLQFAARGVGHG